VYPKTYPTVDIAVLKNGNAELLLGRKNNSVKWRFPGGFADPSDNSFEESARREMTEECGNIETGDMKYIGSAKINDWRYRNEADKIVTMLFKTELSFGNPKAADDLEELHWFAVNELPIMLANGDITNEHEPLVKILINNLK
jgi:bifunctional NMN adenylyltransferase/nudix hydrolase